MGPTSGSAHRLAVTGHILYNGVETPMLGWQLYLGAAFIKLFGFSLTAVRMSTLLVAVAMAWLLQRTLALAGINERNAMLGTLAFVLSPLYLMLSVTYMSDIFGLFAVVICLYGCLRALQASTDRATLAWLCFAVATNAVFGTARQIAWLGILVMVPSALYVLAQRGMWRKNPRILLAGGAATAIGAIFVLACMRWLARQPYFVPEHLSVRGGSGLNVLAGFFHAALELPFLLLPLVILFIPELRKDMHRSLKGIAVFFGICVMVVLALRLARAEDRPLLEPTMRNLVSRYDVFEDSSLAGTPPVFLGTGTRVVLTVASLGGLIGLIVSLLGSRATPPAVEGSRPLPLRQLWTLLVPFAVTYSLLLIPRAASKDGIFGRYLLELVAIALSLVVRYYQDRVRTRLPLATILAICAAAIYCVVVVHNMFSFYRARVALAAEIRAGGAPDTSVDNGWEYNFAVELRHSNHLNDPRIEVPANAYKPLVEAAGGLCTTGFADRTPHLRPLFIVSFDPNACYGPAPFAPVHYSRWLASRPGTLYVVRYLPPTK
ncbi:MAG: ArnT family glycosyltransferase [Acidobacteriaceae bacterium]